MMDSGFAFLLAADLLLLSHALFVAFVIFGLVLILVGRPMHWVWVRNPYFRLAHLVAIAVVTVQSWFGIICPLTTWEMALRERAGAATYRGSFVSHWLDELLYYQAPAWAFAACYTLFALAVAASWIWVRPRPFRQQPTKKPAENE